MDRFLIPAVIFFAIYHILKNFTDFLLKRRIIQAGHFDNAGILDQRVASGSYENQEVNRYPSLKWGLVAFFAGIGFVIIDQLIPANQNDYYTFMDRSILPFGIELISISLGFIVYFLIVNFIKKK